MDNNIVASIAITVSQCLPALVIALIGVWLSMIWLGFYAIVVLAYCYVGWIVGNISAGAQTDIVVMTWILAIILVLCLHIGSIAAILVQRKTG